MGSEFLEKGQNPDGSWGSAGKTKYLNIYAPGSGAHLAFKNSTSALCLLALTRVEKKSEKTKRAIKLGLNYLLKTSPQVKRASAAWIGNVWTHAYTIKAFLKFYDSNHSLKDKIKSQIKSQIALLMTYQYLDGGWGYYDFKSHTVKPSGSSTSFLTGSCLIVLKAAARSGFEIPEKNIQRALSFMKRQRKPDNSFLYSDDFKYQTNVHINKKVSSLARSQSSLKGLYEWQADGVKKETIEEWCGLLIHRNMWLDMARKRPVPHESWNKIASYFYYYGMYYGAANLALCRNQSELGKEMSVILMDRQEKNGAWFDFPLYDYGHFYGTAYGLMALQFCAESMKL